MITSAVALAKGLGITITAEGIETEPQYAALRLIEVDFMQGYFFSRSLPHDEFLHRYAASAQEEQASSAKVARSLGGRGSR